MKLCVVFAHGKESGPWGSKIQHLASIAESQGAQVISPDYSDLMDPDSRVERLLGVSLPAARQLVLVGSSMGGYVSALASKTLKPDGLFLMAPALYLPGYREQNPRPYARNTLVVFGWNDTVVPVANGIRFAQQHRTSLHVMDADHRFEGVLPEVGELFRQFIKDVVALN